MTIYFKIEGKKLQKTCLLGNVSSSSTSMNDVAWVCPRLLEDLNGGAILDASVPSNVKSILSVLVSAGSVLDSPPSSNMIGADTFFRAKIGDLFFFFFMDDFKGNELATVGSSGFRRAGAVSTLKQEQHKKKEIRIIINRQSIVESVLWAPFKEAINAANAGLVTNHRFGRDFTIK
jgi:hypothetical protein